MKAMMRRRLGLAAGDPNPPAAGGRVAGERPIRALKIWRLPEDSDEQIALTVALMIRESVSGSYNPYVRKLASFARLHARTLEEVARAYTRLVADRVGFRFDPEEIELVRQPAALAQDILERRPTFGDCDDMALLLAALLLSQGIPVAFVTISTSPHNRDFRHVFVAAKLGHRWDTFDPSVSRPYSTQGLRHRWWMVPLPPPA